MAVGARPATASIVHITDTQFMTYAAASFTDMTQWVADNAAALNIVACIHTGDLIDLVGNTTQWGRAVTSMAVLDAGTVPYLLTTGPGHDQNKDRADTATFNSYFPQATLTAHDWFNGGFYEDGHSENAWITVNVVREPWLLIVLEPGPRQAVLTWAAGVMAAHPNHRAAVFTHSYLSLNGARQDWGYFTMHYGDWEPDVHDGEEVWDEMLTAQANAALVQCGHETHRIGVGPVGTPFEFNAISTGDNGNSVIEAVANYQDVTENHRGSLFNHILRVITITPSRSTMHQRTYSVTDGEWLCDSNSDWVASYA